MGRSKQQTARSLMRLFGVVFLLGGLLSGYIAGREALHSWVLTNQGMRAEAEVVDYPYVRWAAGPRGSGNAVRLKFSAADGTETMFVTRPRVPRGVHPIYYMPGNPQDAKVDSFRSLWLWVAVGSGICLVLLVIGGSILARSMQRW
jgi:hypothetical protein